jgi:cytochrome P450
MPWVGDLIAFVDDRLAFIDACARRGDAVPVRFGHKRTLVVSHPDLIRAVAALEPKHFVRGISGAAMRPVVGDGLLISEGEEWKRQRRYLQPLFGADRIALWQPHIVAATHALLGRWRDGERRDLLEEMHRLTLDIAARVLLGIAADGRGELHPALRAYLAQDLFRTPIPLGPLGRFVGSDDLRGRLDAMIYARIADARSGNADGMVVDLVHLGAADREIRDQIMTLIVTAEDTTASALTWMWHLVSQDARVERALRAEDRAGAASRPYLAAVLNETLRLYPPVIGEARECVAACEIAGVTVRPGDLVMFSQWAVHRDARWFERAAEFVPERWLDGLEDRLHPFAYFPFGGGRRVCIGRLLATAIALAAMPIVLRRYHLEGVPGHRPRIQAIVTMRPRGGLPLRVRALH